MRFRTLALAMALGCGFGMMAEARKPEIVKTTAKRPKSRVKKAKKVKGPKRPKSKVKKVKRVKHA